MIINVAIIEDEQPFCEQLSELLLKWAADRRQLLNIHPYISGENFLIDWDSGTEFDVVFIDIMLPYSLNGLEIARHIRKNNEQVALIFVTSVGTEIGEGYRVSAMQYLIKPASYADIEMCMDRVIKSVEQYRETVYCLQQGKSTLLRIPYKDILYFSSSLHYIEIHTAQETIRQLIRLKNVEAKLPDQFVRCHRSYIVNLEATYLVTPHFIKLIDKTTIPISKTYLENVKNKVSAYYRQEVL